MATLTVVLSGHAFGDIETRNRSCVLAVSDGLPQLNLDQLKPEPFQERLPLNHYLEHVPLDSVQWKSMDHVKRKDIETAHNFSNLTYSGTETRISTITASYAAPKASAPMVLHPTNPDLQRQFSPEEHGNIRQLPDRLYQLVMDVAYGRHPLSSKRGSKTLAHRMMGNSVSKRLWVAFGQFLGRYFMKIRDLIAYKQYALFAA